MLEPLLLLLPVYLLILLGFAIIKTGLIDPEALPQLSRFMLIVCIPVLIFSAVSSAGDLASFNWRFVLGYALAALCALTLARVVLRKAFGFGPGQSWVVALGAANSNSVFLGFPIAIVVFPDLVDRLFAWVLLVENMVVIPFAATLGDALTRQGAQPPLQAFLGTMKTTLTSPTTLGLIAGLLFTASGLSLAVPIETTRGLIVAAAPLISLFLVGGNVARSTLSEVDMPVFFIALMKLFAHPALTFLFLSAMPGIPDRMVLGGTLFAAMPMFAIYVIFAARHRAERLASSALVVSTVLGAATVGALVVLVSG